MTRSEKNDAAMSAIAKIEEAISNGEMVVFTPEEANALKEVSALWLQMKAVRSFGLSLGKTMVWIVLIFSTWAAIQTGVIEHIRQGLQK